MKKIALLALILMLCCCVAAAEDMWELPDCEMSPVEVFFREERCWRYIPANTYLTVDGFGTEGDYDFFYDSVSKTLKMNTVSLVGGIAIDGDSSTDEDGFPETKSNSLTLELIGDSVINSESWGHALGHNYVAAFEGEHTNLTVTGSGSLRINARPGVYPSSTLGWDENDELQMDDNAACMAFRSLNMKSGTLQLTAGDAKNLSAGMGMYDGGLIVNEGAKIIVETGDAIANIGIQIQGTRDSNAGAFKVNGGSVSVSSGDGMLSVGILAMESSVSGGSVYVMSGNPLGDEGGLFDDEQSALSAAFVSVRDVQLSGGRKLYASRTQSGVLVPGQMAPIVSLSETEKSFAAVENGDDVPAQRVLIDTDADIPASGDRSRPFVYLAMVGAALTVLISMKKRVFAR